MARLQTLTLIAILFCVAALAQLQYDRSYQPYGQNQQGGRQQPAVDIQPARGGFRPADGVKPWQPRYDANTQQGQQQGQPSDLNPYVRVGPALPQQQPRTRAGPNYDSRQPQAPINRPQQQQHRMPQVGRNQYTAQKVLPGAVWRIALRFKLQLNQYTNRDRALPGGKVCYDNAPMPPPPLDGGGGQQQINPNQQQPRQQNRAPSQDDCQLTFITSIVSVGDPVRTVATQDFVQLTEDNTSPSLTDPNTGGGTWYSPHQFDFERKPVAISVTVLHTGNQRFKNGTWGYRNARYTVVVDSFFVNLTGNNIQARQMRQNVHVSGTELNTVLTLSYGYDCMQSFTGPDCDLLCNKTESSSEATICRNVFTGFQTVCQYRSGQQATNCQECIFGVTTDANGKILCRTEANGKSVTYVYNSGYRTATIILSILLAFLIILTIVVCCVAFCLSRRDKNTKTTPWSQWPYRRHEDQKKGLPPPSQPMGPAGGMRRVPAPSDDNYPPQRQNVSMPQSLSPPKATQENGSYNGDVSSQHSFNGNALLVRREAAV